MCLDDFGHQTGGNISRLLWCSSDIFVRVASVIETAEREYEFYHTAIVRSSCCLMALMKKRSDMHVKVSPSFASQVDRGDA